jgi:hypothetical protein
MRHHLIAAAALAALAGGTAASAQSGQAGSHNPAIKDGAPHIAAAPASGANSFTADQARGRFAKAGYTAVSKPMKRDGVWHATATKDGKRATVMLDYKGNVTAR